MFKFFQSVRNNQINSAGFSFSPLIFVRCGVFKYKLYNYMLLICFFFFKAINRQVVFCFWTTFFFFKNKSTTFRTGSRPSGRLCIILDPWE